MGAALSVKKRPGALTPGHARKTQRTGAVDSESRRGDARLVVFAVPTSRLYLERYFRVRCVARHGDDRQRLPQGLVVAAAVGSPLTGSAAVHGDSETTTVGTAEDFDPQARCCGLRGVTTTAAADARTAEEQIAAGSHSCSSSSGKECRFTQGH
ncbi:hypothetical protein J6590_026873 [Homalodisca vitripennis]|nr:hypothetical protein J6590_026873 [Homalodisca vitripennis]